MVAALVPQCARSSLRPCLSVSKEGVVLCGETNPVGSVEAEAILGRDRHGADG